MMNRLQDVFASLNKHDVKYVVLGGIAAVLYGVPRATFDLDMLIEATSENVKNLLTAFREAGLGTASLISVEELLKNEITVFKDRVRIDVQTSTPGLNFADAWEHKEIMRYKGQEFYIINRDDLIASKEAAGRDVDLEDVRLLRLEDRKEDEEDK